ncbi:hypothetical protein BH11PAT4_BH11PAT4_0310 [soil metagenome]
MNSYDILTIIYRVRLIDLTTGFSMRSVILTKTNAPMGSLPSSVHGESTGKIK